MARRTKSDIPEITVSFSYKQKAAERKSVSYICDAVEMFKPFYDDFMEHHEECWAMFLNKQNQVLGVSQIGKGGYSSCVVDVRIPLQIALKVCASSIILSHNHTSGILKASIEDMNLTEKMSKACEILGMRLIDSIILTRDSYLSICGY